MRRAILILAVPMLLSGCVERLILVRSEPPGATVFVDGEKSGETPCDIRYAWYGTRTLTLEKAGFSSAMREVALRPPWWQIFPLDFFADVLLPFTITDRTEVHFLLQEVGREKVDPEEMKKRAEELRKSLRE